MLCLSIPSTFSDLTMADVNVAELARYKSDIDLSTVRIDLGNVQELIFGQ